MLINAEKLKKKIEFSHELKINNVNKKKKNKITKIKKKFKDVKSENDFNVHDNDEKRKEKKFNKKSANVKRFHNNNA